MSKFRKEFEASNVLIDCMNEIIDKYKGRLKLKGNLAQQDLDLLVAAMFAKAGKTFQAILKLSSLGFGEDALILLRSNINLMVNLGYILAQDSVERAGDLIASSHKEQVKYLAIAHQAKPKWVRKLKWDRINKGARRWKNASIERKAEEAKQSYHYDVGYRFYSSLEHSDAWALSRYVVDWNEIGPKISSAPSNAFVGIALVHNFWVTANIFLAFCSHYSIQESQIVDKLDENWKKLGGQSALQRT